MHKSRKNVTVAASHKFVTQPLRTLRFIRRTLNILVIIKQLLVFIMLLLNLTKTILYSISSCIDFKINIVNKIIIIIIFQYYQITCQPVNQAICIFNIVPIVL